MVDVTVVPPNICLFAVVEFGRRMLLSNMSDSATIEICTKTNGVGWIFNSAQKRTETQPNVEKSDQSQE